MDIYEFFYTIQSCLVCVLCRRQMRLELFGKPFRPSPEVGQINKKLNKTTDLEFRICQTLYHSTQQLMYYVDIKNQKSHRITHKIIHPILDLYIIHTNQIMILIKKIIVTIHNNYVTLKMGQSLKKEREKKKFFISILQSPCICVTSIFCCKKVSRKYES